MENTGQAPEAPQNLDTDGAAEVLLERFQKKIDQPEETKAEENAEEVAEPVEEAPEEGQAEETEEAPAEPESEEELEWEGKKFKVKGASPQEIRDALLRQADYTRKTMAVSERSKAVEAKEKAFEERAKLHEETLQQRAQMFALETEYQGLVQALPQLQGEDRTNAIARIEQLRYFGAQVTNAIKQKEEALTAKQQADKLAELQRGDEILRRELPGWGSPETVKKIVSAGRALGASDDYLKDSTDPILMKALHKAALYDELQARKPQITKKVAEAPKAIKPGPGNQSNPGKTRAEEADARLRKSGRLDDAANAILARIVKGR